MLETGHSSPFLGDHKGSILAEQKIIVSHFFFHVLPARLLTNDEKQLPERGKKEPHGANAAHHYRNADTQHCALAVKSPESLLAVRNAASSTTEMGVTRLDDSAVLWFAWGSPTFL